MWLLVAAALWLEAGGGSPVLAGALLGAGALLKLYPLVFVAPLVALGRRRTAAATLVTTLVGLAVPHTWDFYAGSLGERLGRRVDLHQNASLVGLFHYLLSGLGRRGHRAGRSRGVGLYALLLGLCVFGDWRRSRSTPLDGRAIAMALALYLPFIGAIPRIAYCYVLVGLILALPWIEDAWSRRPPGHRGDLRLFAIGVALALRADLHHRLRAARPRGGARAAPRGQPAVHGRRRGDQAREPHHRSLIPASSAARVGVRRAGTTARVERHEPLPRRGRLTRRLSARHR